MKKHWQHIIAMAMAAAALLPWRIMNKGSGTRSSDGGWYRINNTAEEDASRWRSRSMERSETGANRLSSFSLN